MRYLARLSYNRSGWRHPTGDAKRDEEEGTYNQKHGFGHEDWLFRNEWLIDGWRYGFVQGVNKSHTRLVAENEPFELTLFTIEPDGRRRYIAVIQGVECLPSQQADWALEAFKKMGWYDTMVRELIKSKSDSTALGNAKYARHILNVRFRLQNLHWFPPNTYGDKEDSVFRVNYYVLANLDKLESKTPTKMPSRFGSSAKPNTQSFTRRGTNAIQCNPEHAHMQAQLMDELKAEFPGASIKREVGFVDVIVRTKTEICLFEIKSDLEAKSVIREALGQILEYAYHPSRSYSHSVRLVIVGRSKLPPAERTYLNRLRNEFNIPIDYRVVSI